MSMPEQGTRAPQCPDGFSSCLAAKLSHYVTLDDRELARLEAVQAQPRKFARDELLFREGDHNQDLYIVQEGWLFNYIDAPDGRRQIVNIYHSGDVIGFPDMALEQRTTNLFAVEAGSLCPMPKETMADIYTHCPRLAALMLTIALREETVLIDRLRTFSRSSARARVAYLFLELQARLAVLSGANGGGEVSADLYMPLNQQEIGDAVGLTNVSVSRATSQLEDQGWITTGSKRVTLRNPEALKALCDFHDRYASMATDWFPQQT